MLVCIGKVLTVEVRLVPELMAAAISTQWLRKRKGRVGIARRVSSIHLLTNSQVLDCVMSPFEEPVIPDSTDQGVGSAVVVHVDFQDECVRSVAAASVLDESDSIRAGIG
jgi:hypothetical protein